MRKVGNTASNKVYNPVNQKPPVPIDADESDAAMERFIRQKYVNSAFSKSANPNRHRNTGSSGSDDIPPPLPPKTPGRFGLRSASSVFPLSSKAKRETSSTTVSTSHSNGNDHFESGGHPPSSPPSRAGPFTRNTVSQALGFGDSDVGDNSHAKLASLRDMGFSDERRNTVVLKSVSWDLDRAVEMLMRMGDAGVSNGRMPPHSLASPRESSLFAPTRTNISSTQPSMATIGLSMPTLSSLEVSSSPALNDSSNPFDALDFAAPPAPPQSSQSTGSLQNKIPFDITNPFGIMPTPQQQAPLSAPTITASSSAFNLNQAFQNMALSPPQSLFPHHTGSGVPLQQQQLPQAQSPFATPSSGHSYFTAASSAATQHGYTPQLAPYNPFLTPGGQQQQQQQQQWDQSYQALSSSTNAGFIGNNPFTRSPTRLQSSNALGQIPEQAQANYFTALTQSQTYPLSHVNLHGASVPTLPSSDLQQIPQKAPEQLDQLQQQTNNPFFTQPPVPSQVPRLHNTASIMALYNMQQPSTTTTLLPVTSSPAATTTKHTSTQLPTPQPLQPPGDQFLGRSTSENQSTAATFVAATNPFFGITTNVVGNTAEQMQQAHVLAPQVSNPYGQRQPPPPPGPSEHAVKGAHTTDLFVGGRSRDSIMALGMEWSNGRHSPDAFASLSARH